MYKQINNKKQFYGLFYQGHFGNHGPMWKTFEQWEASRYPGLIAIRSLRAGGRCDYNIRPEQVAARVLSFTQNGYSLAELNYSAMMPDEHLVIQGEVSRTITGLHMFYADVPGIPMRPALKNHGQHATGVAVSMLLRWAADPSSFDNIMDLLDRYPDHVVEFSCLSINWGVIPGRNTVIWEVRNY